MYGDNQMYGGNQMFGGNQFWSNGPAPGQFYNFGSGPHLSIATQEALREYSAPGTFGTQRTTQPINTGTSVVGIKFDSGVMIAADNLISYGSLARYQDVPRVFKVNEKTLIGTGGDFADFQSLKRTIDQKMIEDVCSNDSIQTKPKSLYNWLTRVLYNRRSRMNPLWLDMIVAGYDDGAPFLGHIDMRGRAYEDKVIATGFGKHLALPLIREKMVEDKLMNREEATNLLRQCMEVMFYRDCRAISKYTVATCTASGSTVEGPFDVKQNWEVAAMVKGY